MLQVVSAWRCLPCSMDVSGQHLLAKHAPACLRTHSSLNARRAAQEMNVLGMEGRGRERHPGVITHALAPSKCISCGQCAVVCPVSRRRALLARVGR